MSRLTEQRKSERITTHGIDYDAVVSVRVVEGRDMLPMDMTGYSDPYVQIKCGNQTWKTNYIKQDLNPVWNEVYNFDVETGREELEVTVWDKDDFGSDDFEGKF